MGYLMSTKRSKIFNEFSKEMQEEYFSIKRSKVLHNIDTLYFSVSLENDSMNNDYEPIKNFIYILNSFKGLDIEEKWFDFDKGLLYKEISFGFYRHCISFNSMYDIFIAEKIPNDQTPRIVVQIRSNCLWNFGDRNSIEDINLVLIDILGFFNININKINENRIDYAFHTNTIQNFDDYFSDNYIKNCLDTQFKIGSKVFTKEKNNLNITYFSLGNRKSNNLFFRTYNKTLEVVEMAYKDFFFDIWLENGLISKYDHYILTYCYKFRNFNKRFEAMINFYSEFGSDSNLITNCNSILNNPNATLDNLREFTKGICPPVTIVQNFEFQTMRKFYFNGSEFIDILPVLENCSNNTLRLFQILDNRKIFIDYLVNKLVVFNSTKGLDVADFWKRIQTCKLDSTVQIDYKRKYNHNRNIEYVKNRIRSSLATLSLYKGNKETDLIYDLCDLINTFNDNDIKNIERYKSLKEKKEKAQKNINALKTFSTDNN